MGLGVVGWWGINERGIIMYYLSKPTLRSKDEYFVKSELKKVQARVKSGLAPDSTTVNWEYGEEVRDWLASLEKDIKRIKEGLIY